MQDKDTYSMKAVILAAKKKDDMFPFVDSMPTGLMPVAGKPIVRRTVESLRELGVEDIYLVTNYLEQMYEAEFPDVEIVHQEDLSGTAAAVSTCDFIEEEFIVVNGDVLVSTGDLERLVDKHRESDGEVSLLATGEDKPEKFGVLSITDDRIRSLEEKPEKAENPLVNTGIYVFSDGIFDYLEGEDSLTDAVASVIDSDGARFELVEDYWIDVGSPRKLWKADRTVRQYDIEGGQVSEEAEVSETAEVGDAVVEKDARVEHGAVVGDSSYIGEGATVGPGAVVEDSTVGSGSVVRGRVEKSLVFHHAFLGANTAVQDSVIGEEVDVKPGTVIRESFIGPRSFVEVNNSIYGVKFVPDARTDLGEISK